MCFLTGDDQYWRDLDPRDESCLEAKPARQLERMFNVWLPKRIPSPCSSAEPAAKTTPLIATLKRLNYAIGHDTASVKASSCRIILLRRDGADGLLYSDGSAALALVCWLDSTALRRRRSTYIKSVRLRKDKRLRESKFAGISSLSLCQDSHLASTSSRFSDLLIVEHSIADRYMIIMDVVLLHVACPRQQDCFFQEHCYLCNPILGRWWKMHRSPFGRSYAINLSPFCILFDEPSLGAFCNYVTVVALTRIPSKEKALFMRRCR